VVAEASIVRSEQGLVPQGEGWYVLNAREARWRRRETFGRVALLEAEPIGTVFRQLGFRIAVLRPGEANGMYHRESGQEDFLVVAGECLLLIEEQERRLGPWDFVHCPPGTNHIFVGAGEGPCVVVMVGARAPDSTIVYPVAEVAARHGASVERETPEPNEAYAEFPPIIEPYRDGDLPV
jgi:uncharacterized cupin superfamily protein